MFLDKEERKLLDEIRDEVLKLIEKKFDEYGYDKAYFEFILKVNILDDTFKKVEEIELFNEESKGYCVFCRKPTYFYASTLDYPALGIEGYICAECLEKIRGKNETIN